MNFYLAKIVYQVICGEGKHTAQFDEQLRLIAAAGYTEALDKAAGVGRQGEYSFLNQHKKLVQWKFINVCELYCINEYADGAEVYSTIKERYDAGYFINEVHHKASRLHNEPNILTHAS